MINRRHIRIKVMQSIYAMLKTGNNDLKQEERKLLHSIEKINHLYALLLNLFLHLKQAEKHQIEISQKKHLKATKESVDECFAKNEVLESISGNSLLMDYVEKHNLDYWKSESQKVLGLLQEIQAHKIYQKQAAKSEVSFNESKSFLVNVFKEIIAPNEKISEFLEETCISWTDDLPYANTMIINHLERLKKNKKIHFGAIFKDEDDRDFVVQLFSKTALNLEEYNQHLKHKTPNWDQNRIAQIDLILIKMAICEFLNFPSIPTRASINEYLEISKEYSTKKSSFFINGILDRVVKEFEEQDKLQKIGRGLL